jgi:hypothetical protein
MATRCLAVFVAIVYTISGVASAAEHCTHKPTVNSTALNATYTFEAMPSPFLVPFPASLRAKHVFLDLSKVSAISVTGTSTEKDILHPAAVLLAAELNAISNGAVDLGVLSNGAVEGEDYSPLHTIMLALTTQLDMEAYSLDISSSTGVKLTAGTFAGISEYISMYISMYLTCY